MKKKYYFDIAKHYERCLKTHGDNYLGVDWLGEESSKKRYRVILELFKNDNSKKITLLDFGCGASHLYEYIIKNNIKNIEYSGLDISKKFIKLSEKKFPETNYYCVDILNDKASIPEFDYIIINGVFTVKLNLSYRKMLSFFKQMLIKIFKKSKKGVAFNVVSNNLGWKRKELFHLSYDKLAKILNKKISSNFIIRNDYGLDDYTVYVYKG